MLRESAISAATGIVILLAAGVAQAVPVVVDSWSLTTEAGDEGVRATSLEVRPAEPQGRQTGMSSFSRRYKS